MARKRPYVGVTIADGSIKYEAFMSDTEPTSTSHGSKYTYGIGPFYTKSDAEYYVDHTLYLSPVALLPSKVHQMRIAEAEEASGQDRPQLVESHQGTQTCEVEGCTTTSNVTVETWLTSHGYVIRWACPQCHTPHYSLAVGA